MSNPTVSVIIPTYNRANYLNRTINSVLNQTFKDFELIIVDDGSTDNTKSLVREFSKNDSRIKYIWQENSGGPSKPLNNGIINSKGKYIAFLGSDDEFLPEKLEKQIKKFDSVEENVGLVYCGLRYVPENGKKSKIVVTELRGDLFNEILENSFIAGIAPLVKSECFQKLGILDESLPSGEDWDMWIRISKNYKFDYVPEPLAIYHIHGKQISSNFDDTIKGFERILEKYFQDISRYPKIHSTHLIRVGIFCCLNGEISKGQKYYRNAIEIKPLQIIAYLNLWLSKIPFLYNPLLIFLVKRLTLTGMFNDF